MTPELAALFGDLERDEGLRLKPYFDTVGKLTIGHGRNLDDVGITHEEADYLLRNDIARTLPLLERHLPWWKDLDPVRRRVLAEMAFNLGVEKLELFKNTLAAVRAGNFVGAANGMLASLWAKQVGARAQRLARLMATGDDVDHEHAG